MEERVEVLEKELEQLKSLIRYMQVEVMAINVMLTNDTSWSICKYANAKDKAEEIQLEIEAAFKTIEAQHKAQRDLTTKPQRSAWVDQQLYTKEEE